MAKESGLRVTLLGTGTSQGIPVIGCDCEVCRSDDPRDRRLRVSVMLSWEGRHVVIDAGPDFRQQMLRAAPDYLEAVLITHEHNDHIIGLDDVRPFNFMRRENMPVYCIPQVAEELRQRFAYVFAEVPYPGAPMIELREFRPGDQLLIGGRRFRSIPFLHGRLPVMGFHTGGFAYLTDIKTIEDDWVEKIRGVHTLILSALHHQEHHSHLNLREALELIERIQPEQTYLTHLSHRMGRHAEVEPTLPPGVRIAHDGQVIEVPG